MKVLLIDNYDSYSYNLFHLLATLSGDAPIIVQNDDFDGKWDKLLANIPKEDFDCIVVGPGPGTPNDEKCLGLSAGAIARADLDKPVLGVCLGMQAMARILGGSVHKAPRPMHGRLSSIVCSEKNSSSPIFKGVSFPFQVVRYHSLCVDVVGCQDQLRVTSIAEDDGVIMSLEHLSRPLFGVQYHPESICAGKEGPLIVENFLRYTAARQSPIKASLIPGETRPTTRPRLHSANSTDDDRVTRNGNDAVLLVMEVDGPKELPEAAFERLFGTDSCRAWLDSAMQHPRRGQLSILCGESASTRFSERVEFFVERPRLELHADHETLRNYGERSLLRAWTPASPLEKEKAFVVRNARTGRGCEPFEHMKRSLAFARPKSALYWKAGANKASEVTDLSGLPCGDFCGGFVGAMGYGLRKLCGVKSVRDESKEITPDEALRLGAEMGAPDLAFFFCDRAVVFDLAHNRAFALALSDNSASSHDLQLDWVRSASKTLRECTSESAIASEDAPIYTGQFDLRPVKSKAEYEADVRRCLDEITSGETYEVCLTNQLIAEVPPKETMKPSGLPLSQIYRTLRRSNPAPFGAFFRFETSLGRSVSLLSSSPERYLRVDRTGMVESRPIKGTVARVAGSPIEEDEQRAVLSGSEKDRAENLMIVDLVRNDLGRVCKVGTVSVPELFVVESFRTVHQLVSTIQGQLEDGLTAVDAARAAFPPGSMTGAPKLRTMQIIDDVERGERGFYSGALGFFSVSGAADFAVIIRTVTVLNDTAMSVGAGGAVVALSDPEKERLEMGLKVKALGALFRLVEQ